MALIAVTSFAWESALGVRRYLARYRAAFQCVPYSRARTHATFYTSWDTHVDTRGVAVDEARWAGWLVDLLTNLAAHLFARISIQLKDSAIVAPAVKRRGASSTGYVDRKRPHSRSTIWYCNDTSCLVDLLSTRIFYDLTNLNSHLEKILFAPILIIEPKTVIFLFFYHNYNIIT
jgi:hypothetical protein